MTGLNPYLSPKDLKQGEDFLPDRILEVSDMRDPRIQIPTELCARLQIACIVTNKDLEPLDDGVEFIVKTEKDVLDRMNEWCTGLTQACLDATHSMEQVDALVAAYVAKHFPTNAPALLAGNSVHADRAFINKDLPQLASKLHYRILDVSSIKELGRRWYPQLGWQSKKDEAEHRALADIKASINELRYYRQHLFKPVEPRR
ncbi:hypothetical protein Rhopal_005058-T1 [Rhodotorula paludigena]|uniref:Exonuclease domain-containing protein n=1 Tax=Rhodotorula paludigena TaxID=86838 RepID=A0AAV5GHC8_9BASI|nr:hypothetical protein Rhopal_005058-T1 [Rhodotorula paludigena]